LGWVLDRLGINGLPFSSFPLASTFISAAGGGAVDATLTVDGQLGAAAETLFNKVGPVAVSLIGSATGAPGDLLAIRKAADEDLNVNDVGFGGQQLGNGGSDTIYRLREGIERFLITNINNAAQSAQAQSTVFIMMDQIGTGGGVALFNHVPGGCNVLYLDGHVDFLRYVADSNLTDNSIPGDAPVISSVAAIIGAIATI
jgi:prepilin-type processing-associated H-X9-DG protein